MGILFSIVIEESILIDANIDKVWEIFTDLTCWKDWNTVMRDVCSNEKCLMLGGELTCCFRPFLFPITVKIKVHEVTPFERVVWSAKKKGMVARHEFSFQKQERGILVTSRETFNGILVKVFALLLPEGECET